jgi:hypothetical protein
MSGFELRLPERKELTQIKLWEQAGQKQRPHKSSKSSGSQTPSKYKQCKQSKTSVSKLSKS